MNRTSVVRLVALWLSFATLLFAAWPAWAAPPDLELWGHAYCPHCKSAKAYLVELREARPGLVVVEHDVVADEASLDELERLLRAKGVEAASVPTFRVRGEQLVVGFDTPDTTGRLLEALLDGKPADGHTPPTPAPHDAPAPSASAAASASTAPPAPATSAAPSAPSDVPARSPGSTPASAGAPDGERVTLPGLGEVDVRALGLPVFTVVIGLVDGFNPCAMWVLLFLLALLVNVESRARMALVASTFVVVSGLAYYAFMAAWLNVFLLVGLSRAVQVVLGLLAIGIGVVHVKDFFALHQGPSLSIPESAKPGIYARVRNIVRAKSVLAALAGAAVLAVLVNMVELLCTAGLPAVYTQVLVRQGVSDVGRYAYLALYIVAYMFDDALMVGIAVVTLGRRKLQERQGRWLKLLSGSVVLVLGVLMLVAPEWLVW